MRLGRLAVYQRGAYPCGMFDVPAWSPACLNMPFSWRRVCSKQTVNPAQPRAAQQPCLQPPPQTCRRSYDDNDLAAAAGAHACSLLESGEMTPQQLVPLMWAYGLQVGMQPRGGVYSGCFF